MSMRSWSEYGFGFPLYNGDNYEQVVRFIIRNGGRDYTDDEVEDLMGLCKRRDEALLQDFFDNPVSFEVASIINDLEGTTFVRGYSPCGDTDQEEYIGIEPCYSWEMRGNDMKIKTVEDASVLLTKYASQLGVSDKPDYFEALYFG